MFVIHSNPIFLKDLLLIVKVFQENLKILPAKNEYVFNKQNNRNITFKTILASSLNILSTIFSLRFLKLKKSTLEIITMAVFGCLISINIIFMILILCFLQFNQRMNRYTVSNTQDCV